MIKEQHKISPILLLDEITAHLDELRKEKLFSEPKHPYTCLLIESIPKIGLSKDQRLSTIEGNVPIPLNLKNECGFFSRCPKKIDGLCNRGIPELNKISEDHKVSCFLYDQKSSP